MKKYLILLILSFIIHSIHCDNESKIAKQEKEAEQHLKEITPALEKHLLWLYENNFKDKAKLSLVEQFSLEYDNEEVMEFFKDLTDYFKKYKFEKFKNKDLARQILLLISRDERILSTRERQEFLDIQEESKTFLNKVKFCEYNSTDDTSCNLGFGEVIIYVVLSESEEETEWYWKQFSKKVGTDRRPKFNRLIELYRKIAKLNGFDKPSDLLLAQYEDKNIVQKVGKLVNELKPFYLQFHAYVRHQLREKYGDKIPEKGPIPFKYMLQNYFWSETVTSELDYPYPSSPIPDYDTIMQAQNYTPQRFIQESDEFFKSMGFSSALTKDWEEFIRRDDEGEETDSCEPKAKSYLAKGSLTFTYCDTVDFRNYYNTHAQMLIVHQYNNGKNLPLIYRKLFPPAFESALEKSMKFAVSTPAHMNKVGIVAGEGEEILLNRLYLLAFKVIFDILQGYGESIYFHNVLDGVYNTSNSNCEYWQTQHNYLGVQPFGKVSNEDFDYTASGSSDFQDNDFENIIARLTAFNIYETFCKVSGKYEKGSSTKPLNNCDFSGSSDAGQLLTKVMKTGASKPWYKIFTEITLKDNVDTSSILEYFEPLRAYMENENKKNNVHVGWEQLNICE